MTVSSAVFSKLMDAIVVMVPAYSNQPKNASKKFAIATNYRFSAARIKTRSNFGTAASSNG